MVQVSAIDRLAARWQRLQARWRLITSHGDELNRRVEVENVLLACAAEKRPALTPEECRALAYKLGVPSRYSRKT